MGQIGKAALLRMEAEAVEAGEQFVASKSKRKRCSECGRPLADPRFEKQIGKARSALAEKRTAFREARDAE